MTQALATVETSLLLPAPEHTLHEAHAAAVEAVRRLVPAATIFTRQEIVSHGHTQGDSPTLQWEISVVMTGTCFLTSNADFDRALADVLLKVRDAITACPVCGRHG